MAFLPVSAADLVKTLNLPADLAENPIWGSHEQIIMNRLMELSIADAMDDALEGDPDATDSEYYYPMRAAYCYLMLADTVDLLNLSTTGTGIIKSIGLDQSETELLSGDEIDQFALRMETKALKAISSYLSQIGKDRLESLSPRAPKPIRLAII